MFQILLETILLPSTPSSPPLFQISGTLVLDSFRIANVRLCLNLKMASLQPCHCCGKVNSGFGPPGDEGPDSGSVEVS
jgi:hypothetical protein